MKYNTLIRKRGNLINEIKLRQKRHKSRRRLSELLIKLTTLQLKKEIRGNLK